MTERARRLADKLRDLANDDSWTWIARDNLWAWARPGHPADEAKALLSLVAPPDAPEAGGAQSALKEALTVLREITHRAGFGVVTDEDAPEMELALAEIRHVASCAVARLAPEAKPTHPPAAPEGDR